MDKKSRDRQDFLLWALFLQTHDAMSRAREAELREHGLSIVQGGVLYLVKHHKEPVSPAMLSRWLLRKRPSVKALLDRMERDGLVRQIRDLPRSNAIRVVLTEKGEEVLQRSSVMTTVHNILGDLTDEQRNWLEAILNVLQDRALAQIDFEYTVPFPWA